MRLEHLGAHVAGLDLSEESIAIARMKNPGISFYVGNMLEDYRYIDKVDAIICLAGLVHLPVDQLRMAFKRMPLRYNNDKPEKPRNFKGLEVYQADFSSFSNPKNQATKPLFRRGC